MAARTLCDNRLRAAGAVAGLWALGVACGAPQPAGVAEDSSYRSYLDDASFRRADLVASLVNPANDYSTLRLAHYATGDRGDWDLLPEWNPPAEPIASSELDRAEGASTTVLSDRAAPLALPGAIDAADSPALLALGAAAFARYPAQVAPYFGVALTSRAAAARYGLWVDEGRGVGGLVRARMADGSAAVSLTCSTCHSAASVSGALTAGLPNRNLDLGAAILGAPGALLDVEVATAIAAWGPGRLDVTTSTGTEPVRIPDLRPVRWLTYLQQDATLRARDLATLAIRIETLIITANDQALRPPRVVSLALAAYLVSLADTLPAPETAAAASPEGARVFAAECAGCHVPPGFTGAPVPLATVGTDPTLGRSLVRGTGAYRVPSLHGVGTRGPLLHDGTVPSLDAMFDPARPTPSFADKLHGEGPVPGHKFGLHLIPGDRAALVAYLRAL